MFFVYQLPTKRVHEFKDFTSLAEHYKSSNVSSSTDLFWTLGLKSWISISDAITDDIVRKRKYSIPSLPPEALDEETQPGARGGAGAAKSATAPGKSANTAPSQKGGAANTGSGTSSSVDEKTSPGILNPLLDEVTREIKVQDTDFVIVNYEQPSLPKLPNEPYKEQRKHQRYDIRLKVIISNKEKTFLSYTSNVSTGGVMLEDNIPRDYFNSETEIFVSSPKKNEFVAFRCHPVGDDSSPKRFSFGQISQTSLEKFQEWIDKLK